MTNVTKMFISSLNTQLIFCVLLSGIADRLLTDIASNN